MKRFAEEWAIMARREKFEKMIHQEWSNHSLPYERCHCFGKPGLLRKSRPLQRSIRFDRAIWRQEKKSRNKRQRREGRNIRHRLKDLDRDRIDAVFRMSNREADDDEQIRARPG